MIVYWLLLLPTALIAYLLGGMDTIVLASNFIFRYNLHRLGKGNDWLSNFRRVYGLKGALLLLLVEAIKDILPIIIGGVLLGFKGHADVGRAFAGFCLVLGRLWPVYYELKGSCAVMPMIFSALFAGTSLGIVVLLLLLVTLAVSRHMPVAALVAGLVLAAASFLIVETKLCVYLLAFTGAALVVRHIPAVKKILEGKAEKLSFTEDLSYKFEEKF